MTVWFTSDLHFGHPSVACRRAGLPVDREAWYISRQHDERVLQVLNSMVAGTDTLYVLGDLSSGSSRSAHVAAGMTARLHPPAKRRHLILGNHDVRSGAAFRTEVTPLFTETANIGWLRENGLNILLSHYPPANLMDGTIRDDVSSNAYSDEYAAYAPSLPGESFRLLHGHTHSHDRVDPRLPEELCGRVLHVG